MVHLTYKRRLVLVYTLGFATLGMFFLAQNTSMKLVFPFHVQTGRAINISNSAFHLSDLVVLTNRTDGKNETSVTSTGSIIQFDTIVVSSAKDSSTKLEFAFSNKSRLTSRNVIVTKAKKDIFRTLITKVGSGSTEKDSDSKIVISLESEGWSGESWEPSAELTVSNEAEFLINTSTCRIQNVHPFAKISDLIKVPKPFRCKDSRNVSFGLVHSLENTLYVNKTVRNKVLEFYKTKKKDFHCCVEFFKRFPDEQGDYGVRNLENCKKFTLSLPIIDEYMYIACYLSATKTNPIYKNFDFAVLRKSHVEARCRAQAELDQTRGANCPDRLSVLVLGIDSVSRLNSLRHLNRTRRVLRRMNAIEFLGYNRVGKNTFPNMGSAMLTGQAHQELDRDCVSQKKQMDNCTFLWDHFGAAGYRTAFVENMNHYGLYTYARKGFRRQPADYYGRTFYNGMKSKGLVDCYRGGASVADDEAVVQWATEFQTEFARDPHFGYFWISVFSHDYLNNLEHVDRFLPGYFKRLAADGGALLNNTLLVFMSDHGLRFGQMMRTEVGQFEINLPFLFLVFPAWYRQRHPETVRRVEENAAGRLTTHYDLHATLRDIAACRGHDSEVREDLPQPSPRGISLFRNIPENRTCKQAGISAHYCACFKVKFKLSASDDRARALGGLVVDKLNEMTARWRPPCALLALSSVDEVWGKKVDPKDDSGSSELDTKYTVLLTTVPGGGSFKSVVKYRSYEQSYKVDEEVMRLDRYGNSSACIGDTAEPALFAICHCVSGPSQN